MREIKIGMTYFYELSDGTGSFTVKVLEKIGYHQLYYQDYLVEVVSCTPEQAFLLVNSDFKMIVRGTSLKEIREVIQRRIEINQIYYCSVPEVIGKIEVQILEKLRTERYLVPKYLVQVIRCSMEQRQNLVEHYSSRFAVYENQILYKSPNFL